MKFSSTESVSFIVMLVFGVKKFITGATFVFNTVKDIVVVMFAPKLSAIVNNTSYTPASVKLVDQLKVLSFCENLESLIKYVKGLLSGSDAFMIMISS